MALKTSDGKPYRTLFEPNPILKEQESIEEKNLVFHNFKWEPTVVEGLPPVTQQKKKKKRPALKPESLSASTQDDFMELIRKEASELKAEKKPEPPKPKDIMDNNNVVIVHCQTATIREREDDFYGETRKTIQYGENTQFEALIVESNDLGISLFVKNDVSIGSVLYPSVYKNGEKLNDNRWWRVTRSKPTKDGFILIGEITNYQASF